MVTGAQRTSVFDPRPSLTILPPSVSPLGMGEREIFEEGISLATGP